jgi:hypothetical protein
MATTKGNKAAKETTVTFVKDKNTKRFARYTANEGPIVGNLYVSKEYETVPKSIVVVFVEE